MYPKVLALANAMKHFEGMDPSCNNPLALRWSPYEDGQRTYPGKGTFAYFKTPGAGFAAGIHQLLIVCEGVSPAYNAEARKLGLHDCAHLTLQQFIRIYSPASDHNLPDHYAETISEGTGIPLDTRMGELIQG